MPVWTQEAKCPPRNFPGGTGDVVGPGSAADNDVAVFSGTTGKLLKTTSKPIGNLVTGPASATSGRIASYGDTTGKLIADGAKLAADLVTGPASATSGNIATYNGTTGKIIQDSARPVTDIVLGQASSVDSEIALFSGTGGKTIKRATGTGYVTVVSGVFQTPTSADLAGRMPRGHLWGLTLANNATDLINDIDVTAGEARDSTNAVDMVLAGTLTKRLDAVWAVGNNQGGLDTGAVGNNTYHIWLIKRTDGTVVDVLFSLSATAPTMPANYTYKRRIGSIIRASAAIVRFIQYGDDFTLWRYSDAAVGLTTFGTTAVLYPLQVPTGIKVRALLSAAISKAATSPNLMVTSPDQEDQDASTGWAPVFAPAQGATGFAIMQVWTNTSGQIRMRASLATCTIYAVNMGWMDPRGRTN